MLPNAAAGKPAAAMSKIKHCDILLIVLRLCAVLMAYSRCCAMGRASLWYLYLFFNLASFFAAGAMVQQSHHR